MIKQLSPQIPLDTPKGKALAYFLIDMGVDYDLQWVCFIDETRECWTFKNKEIRARENITMGFGKTTEIKIGNLPEYV